MRKQDVDLAYRGGVDFLKNVFEIMLNVYFICFAGRGKTEQNCQTASAFLVSCKKGPGVQIGTLELTSCTVGSISLIYSAEISNIPLNQNISITFSAAVDTIQAKSSIYLSNSSGVAVSGIYFGFTNNYRTVWVKHNQDLVR